MQTGQWPTCPAVSQSRDALAAPTEQDYGCCRSPSNLLLVAGADPTGERVLTPFHRTHFAARVRPHPAVWISGQHASLGPARPRAATPCCRARTARAIGTRRCRHLHLPMSSLQWRNADRPKSVRPAIDLPVQVSGQFVDHGLRRGPFTCPRARAHSCFRGTHNSLLRRSHSLQNASSTALRLLWRLPCSLPDLSSGLPTHTFGAKTQKTNSWLHSAARPVSGFLQVAPIETASARASSPFLGRPRPRQSR